VERAEIQHGLNGRLFAENGTEVAGFPQEGHELANDDPHHHHHHHHHHQHLWNCGNFALLTHRAAFFSSFLSNIAPFAMPACYV